MFLPLLVSGLFWMAIFALFQGNYGIAIALGLPAIIIGSAFIK